ncbi:amino acid adenylation domain-containing protein [Agrobacterium vitis]|nr:amino acid adenylation domain-containing protein [Agrobacterium vitis]MCM2442307.1 amino acid adenylation domain-containing protein [Agrobacterium vitis]
MTVDRIYDVDRWVELPLGDLFRAGLALDAGKRAIADRKVSYSFEDLENLANGYASYLARQCNVRPQDRVLVICRKVCQVPALAVALWKLGAVYMPVDAELPAARLSAIIKTAAPKVIVTFDQVDNLGAFVVNLSELPESGDWDHIAPYRHRGDEIAYVIHTSGSTGIPKGVQITVGNLRTYFCAHNEMLRFTSDSRVISFTPFHFDVSIEDTLMPLSLGAFVYQYNGPPIGELMRRTLGQERITHLIAVSTVLTVISDRPELITSESFPELEMVMTGAEVCAPSVINLWASRLPRARVYNVYGPTEVTIVCLGYLIASPEEGRTTPYPIGEPLRGVEVILLDENGGEITTPDETGELCLGGEQVMAGYLASPEETAQKLFERGGVRYYRSGDRCKCDADGNYHFVGRVDAEIKLNGRRINLAEIEAECLAVTTVARAAVGLIKTPGGRQVIGAVLVADEPTAVEEVRQRLATQLPTYMIPYLWGVASEIRLGRSGKTDSRLLLSALEKQAGYSGSTTVIDITLGDNDDVR